MPVDHKFWPEDPPLLIGYAMENMIPEAPFVRVAIEPRILRIAMQLRQFLSSEVDLSKWL